MKVLKKFTKAREAGSVIFLVLLVLLVGSLNPAFLAPASLLSWNLTPRATSLQSTDPKII